jgi:hypothetical protein
VCTGNRLARNVVAMATGEPSAAPLADNEELTEFVNALKQEVGDTMARRVFQSVLVRRLVAARR